MQGAVSNGTQSLQQHAEPVLSSPPAPSSGPAHARLSVRLSPSLARTRTAPRNAAAAPERKFKQSICCRTKTCKIAP
eukprot:2544025-Pleurochrysis_carterae.AAC.3